MAPALDTPERDDAHGPASPPPSLSAPVDARQLPASPGHAHGAAGTPQMTRASTTARHGPSTPIKRASATEPLRSHDHARHPRQCTSNTPRPSLAPWRPWNGDDDDDPRSALRPPLAAIKGGRLLSIRAHQSPPLILTALLDLSISPSSHPTALIARSPPPPVHGVRRSRRPPLETQLLPGASSSTPTSRRTTPTTAGAPTTSPTPYLRLP
jgi:hypothetical protein